MTDPAQPFDRDDLAAELALGLLEGEERAQALQLTLSDPAFAQRVEQWSLRLAPLLACIPEQAPPSHVWNAVYARIGAAAPTAVFRQLRRWQAGAVTAAAIAACLCIVLVTRSPVTAPSAPVGVSQVALSQLARADGSAPLAVSYDSRAGALRVGRSALATGTKGPELWIIPADGVPRSLGLIRSGGQIVPVREDLRSFLKEGTILAITLEDPASAPHSAPTATPILTGQISTI
jgi:anti-sigma-K factor RskA